MRALSQIVVMLAIGALCTTAEGHIIGAQSVDGHLCTFSGSWAFCPFYQETPTYQGGYVDSIYIDQTSTAGTFFGEGCEQSFASSSVWCTPWQSTTVTGYSELFVPGFSSISGAALSIWDYYYVVMFQSNTWTLYGVGFI